MPSLEFVLPEASRGAASTDLILLGLLIVSGLIVLLVTTLTIAFAIRYRKGSKADRGPLPRWFSRDLEIGWTVATVGLFVTIFAWAASQDFALAVAAPSSSEIHIVGKQWMWKAEHSGGQREINELHLPVDETVALILNSQDVIHSFFVPAFRVKQDVVPGHTERLIVRPDKVGTFRLFCAEYCGSEHSSMIGPRRRHVAGRLR